MEDSEVIAETAAEAMEGAKMVEHVELRVNLGGHVEVDGLAVVLVHAPCMCCKVLGLQVC